MEDGYILRCRLCAGILTLGISIFSDEGEKLDVKKKINTYLSLEVEQGDKLPENICYLCLGRIEEFHKFKTMCSETQLTLKNWDGCLDDENQPFCAEYTYTDREGNEMFISSFSTDSNVTAGSVENPNGNHPEDSTNGHKFSAKKRQKTSSGTSNKVKSNRCGRKTKQNSSEMLVTKGSSETYVNVNGVCSSPLSRYNSTPSRRKGGSHSKNTTQQIEIPEEFTTSDDDEEEVGFAGFIAERHAAEFGYNNEMDSSENEMLEKSTREEEQSQTNNEAMLSVVKQEPVEETYTQYKCNVCYRVFTRKSTFKKHHMMHKGNDPFKCVSCGKPFRNNCRLMHHMNTHRSDGYKCPDCNMQFSEQETFIEHTQTHHRAKQQTSKKSKTMHNERHKKKRYCCKYCKASFQDKHSCTDHMRCHFGEKPYACNLCDKRFTQQANLISHYRVHRNESFECRLCKSPFSSKAQLTEHLSLAHRDVILEVVNYANPGSNDNA